MTSKNPCWIHQGHTLRSFREAKGMTLDVLAREAGLTMEEAFRLETSQQINEQLLEKLSKILNVSLECLRDAEEVVPMYETVTNYVNNFSGNGVVSGVQEPGGSHWENMNFYANPVLHPIEKMVEVYERMVESKEKQIEKNLTELANCRKELAETQDKLKESNDKLEKSLLQIEELKQKLAQAAGK